MFEILKRYKSQNHFFFSVDDKLDNVCNAPKNGSGVYLIYQIKGDDKTLVYIGSSGKVSKKGAIQHRKSGKGGIFDRIVNGKHSDGVKRNKAWKNIMIENSSDKLEIHWYETFNEETKDIPAFVEATLIQDFFNLHDRLPIWNNCL